MTTLRAIITAAEREEREARIRAQQRAAEPTWLKLALVTWGVFTFILCAIALAITWYDPLITFHAWRLAQCAGLAGVLAICITALAWLEWTTEAGRGK